jgi:hypothetical protein
VNDKPTIGSLAGEISGIMSGIFTDAKVGLDLGPKTSLNVKQEAEYYRGILERILVKSERAENAWREYMDSI